MADSTLFTSCHPQWKWKSYCFEYPLYISSSHVLPSPLLNLTLLSNKCHKMTKRDISHWSFVWLLDIIGHQKDSTFMVPHHTVADWIIIRTPQWAITLLWWRGLYLPMILEAIGFMPLVGIKPRSKTPMMNTINAYCFPSPGRRVIETPLWSQA